MDQRVLVSHTAPRDFINTQNWSKVCSSIASQLPLRNVNLKSPLRNTTTTVSDLNVTLVPLESIRDELASQIPGTLLDKPLLHIYILYCQDDDLDTYRNTLKKEVKDWHTSVTSKKNPEWLILQIIRPPDAYKSQTRNVFKFAGTVLSKLKADFNADDRDRVVQLTYVSDNDNTLVWAEFFNKFKEGISNAFSNAIAVRREEVRRSEGQQNMPGWNFCTFFVLKESLATSYEGVNLFEDALYQYEELESLFLHVSKEKNFSWFGSLISPVTGDDSAPLLSISKKPYREMILANTITVFDFRNYILSRQCGLMAKMGCLSDVPRKVASFLGSFSKRLFEIEPSFPRFWIESWIYSSAITAVEQCAAWQRLYDPENIDKMAVDSGNGELLDLARSQLEIVGIELGYIPKEPPFSIALPKRTRRASLAPPNITISSEDILAILQDRDAFYDIYIRLTNQALTLYAEGGRRKFGLKLHGALAALDLHRGHFDKALTTFASLPAHYAPHFWNSLESYMLARALDTHSRSEKAQDVEWMHILLSFLKSYVEHRGADMLFPTDNPTEYISKLVTSLMEAASGLENGPLFSFTYLFWVLRQGFESDLRHPDHPAISLRTENTAKLAEDRDGSYLNVTVRNYLPCDFPADDIIIYLQGRESDKQRFSATVEKLAPGKTQLTLFCPVPMGGTFLHESSEVRAGKLLLQYPQKKAPGKSPSLHQVVKIPSDPLAVNVRIFQSRKVELDRRCLSLKIWTGRNSVSKLELKLSAPSVTFRYWDATLDEDAGDVTFETGENLTIQNLDKDAAIGFSIPYVEAAAVQTMRIDVDLSYHTASEPGLERAVHLVSLLSPSLPVSVNVQDWFRESRLISTFSVSSTTHQHVRVAETQLIVPESVDGELKVTPCSIRQGTITITPSQPARFMYALDSLTGPVRDSLLFVVKYRLLREAEVASIIEDQVRASLDDSEKSQNLRPIVVTTIIESLERDSSWVALYNITGEIEVPELKKDQKEEVTEIVDKARQRLREYRHPETPQGLWRELRLPVDVPVKSIVAIASIRLLGTAFNPDLSNSKVKIPLYAGQPISAELRVHTTFRWGLENDSNRQYVLNYQIEDMTREWLIGGVKQGDFIAKVRWLNQQAESSPDVCKTE
ncbi:hypothetical protein EST38_g3139 [Candolleomyces aberdarensis]|uniref:Trafficking protein particle complex subunit 10 n=1 Tax=Candolleomyces aberdarensis TaxID=2316362 RepID=A0A4Q2DR85_9AGAR|nr:hypothetical protein EST38_g3139 [Candolleomyces aberdarensis]